MWDITALLLCVSEGIFSYGVITALCWTASVSNMRTHPSLHSFVYVWGKEQSRLCRFETTKRNTLEGNAHTVRNSFKRVLKRSSLFSSVILGEFQMKLLIFFFRKQQNDSFILLSSICTRSNTHCCMWICTTKAELKAKQWNIRIQDGMHFLLSEAGGSLAWKLHMLGRQEWKWHFPCSPAANTNCKYTWTRGRDGRELHTNSLFTAKSIRRWWKRWQWQIEWLWSGLQGCLLEGLQIKVQYDQKGIKRFVLECVSLFWKQVCFQLWGPLTCNTHPYTL